MRKHLLVCLFLIVGCSTVQTKQTECENQSSAFPDIVQCVKRAFANDVRAVGNANYKFYILIGEKLAEKVKLKEMSDLDARIEWQKHYMTWKSDQAEESRKNEASKRGKPVTRCSTNGNETTCRTD